MSCGYNCENNCEECDFPDMVIEFVKGYNQALEDLSHELKETFNSEFPSNYHSTRPFYSLENVRILTEVVAEQLKK